MRNETDVVDVQAKGDEKAESLKTIGWISYLLHLIVAVAAVVPGAQVGVGILLIALIIDLIKKDDAAGTWQASHFSWRIRSVIWAAVLYLVTSPLFLLLLLPGRKVYEDEDIFAFHDIAPWAPVHFLMVPKLHIPSMAQVDATHERLLGKMMALAPRLAIEQGCNPYPDGGFRIVCNTGAEGGQEVHHLHVHVMGGPRPWLRG